jgi:flagellar protein FliS
MSAYQSRAAVAYRQTSVQSSSPLELVVLLYDGVLRHLTAARTALQSNDLQARRVAFSRALAIVTELQSTLNVEQGGAIAASLDSLYIYVTSRLLDANRSGDVGALDEVDGLLRSLRDAWSQIGAAPAAVSAARP